MTLPAALFAPFGPRAGTLFPGSWGTHRAGQQFPDTYQVVCRRREGEHPAHLFDPAVPHLPHQRDRLQPSEALFDSFPLDLAYGYPLWRVVRP